MKPRPRLQQVPKIKSTTTKALQAYHAELRKWQAHLEKWHQRLERDEAELEALGFYEEPGDDEDEGDELCDCPKCTVTCPECKAIPGEPCSPSEGEDGNETIHTARHTAAKNQEQSPLKLGNVGDEIDFLKGLFALKDKRRKTK